ncbi:MAG: ATP-dependent Clp protease adaptor ClpS [Sandaracinaceae bacterium]
MKPPSRARLAEMWAPAQPVAVRAHELANEQGSRAVSVPHLAATLLELESILEVTERCGADAELAHYVALATIDELPRRRWWQGRPTEDRVLNHIYSGALGHAVAAELPAVSAELLLVRMLAHDPSAPIVERLDALGLEVLLVRRVVAHGTTEEPPLEDGFGAGRVRVMNDPFTTFELVVEVFETCFGFSADRAERLMRRVHERGAATFQIDEWERARRAVLEARRMSQSRGYPLRLRLERRA